MTVQELFRAGKLNEAIQALGAEVRDRPSDVQRRTFLFELLCFAGEYSRAGKHLTVLADSSPDAQIGTLVYRSALMGERKRQQFFEAKQYQAEVPQEVTPRPGKLNGEVFETIEDADPRVGPRLEMFLAGEYLWLPFAHIGTLDMAPPRLLRDLLWATGAIRGAPSVEGKDFGEVLLPAVYPFSATSSQDSVKLGRETDWVGDVPFGQKLLLLDGERVVPFLEVRILEFDNEHASAS